MKSFKFFTVGVLALALAGSAMADVTVTLTGSSAFRGATSNAIKNLMNFSAPGHGYAYNGTSFTGATFQYFKGTITGVPGVVTIKTNWSGSVAGIRDVSLGNSIGFLPDPPTISISASGTSGAPTGSNVNSVPDIAMADNRQSATKFTSPNLTGGGIVGIVPFAFVASKDAPASMTNITNQLAKNLFSGGFCSAALFTNNTADEQTIDGSLPGTLVYPMGRDPFSGTRVIATAESGVGVFSVLSQYQPVTISSNTITQINLTPADVPNSVVAGDNGFSSGGTLADQMRYSSPAVEDQNNNPGGSAKVCFVTYLGENDAYRAVAGSGSSVFGTNAGNARYLSYNGVSGFGGKFYPDITTSPTLTFSTTNGSNVITGTDTTGLIVGQTITGTGIPASTTISSIVVNTSVTISNNATITGTATNVLGTLTTNLKGNITNGSAVVTTITPNTTGLVAGQAIKGTGIPVDTTILSVDSASQITLSANATATTTALTLNSTNLLPNNVRNGFYTFWSYERILWGNAVTSSADKLNVANKVKTQITTVDFFASGLANNAAMKVSRGADGGTISQQY
jgi:hypothetical protein